MLCAALAAAACGSDDVSDSEPGSGSASASASEASASETASAVETDVGEAVEEEVEVDFAVVFASASAADGEGLWRGCRSCHALEPGQHGTGPALHGVVNRPVQFYDDFNYSGALIEAAEVWTPEELNAFLERPSSYAPGTAMSYNGMRDVEDRANLIAYLATFAD